ncbi:MAG: cache domain-containing protein [Desulfarculus sp.]|nr:cache domain-containing protein [Desulfarculus sp.]
MKKALLSTLVLALVLCGASLAPAATPQEVVDLVKSAVKHYQDKGQEATVAAVADKNGPFVKGELYVFMGTMDKMELFAHPVSPQLVGKDLTTIKDVKGKLFFVEFRNIARDKGAGWTEYWWPKPGSKEAEPKASYIMISADKKVWFGCGAYGIDAKAAEAQAK